MAVTTDEFASYVVGLKGQTLRIPDLRPMLSHWPSGMNPHLNECARIVEEQYVKLLSNYPKAMAKARGGSLPMYASAWFPHASVKQLVTVIYYTLWIFLWDDELDGEESSLSATISTPEGAVAIRDQLLDYLQFHLGLCDANTPEPASPPFAHMNILLLAKEELLSQTVGQRQRLFREFERYMDACVRERTHLNQRRLPTVESYWEQRMGTSAVFTYCALSEYMTGTALPDWVFDSDAAWTMWQEINFTISYANDLFSLHNELSYGPCNSVPIMMKETGQDLTQVVSGFLADSYASLDAFDAAARRFIGLFESEDASMKKEAEEYVDALRTMCTGNYFWSLGAGRYKLSKYLQEDGSLVIPL